MIANQPGFVVVCVEAPSPAAIRIVEIATSPSEAAARRAARALGAGTGYVLPWDRTDPGGDRAAFVLHLDALLAEYGIQVEAIHGP